MTDIKFYHGPTLNSLIRFTVNTFRWQSCHRASKQQASQPASKQAKRKSGEKLEITKSRKPAQICRQEGKQPFSHGKKAEERGKEKNIAKSVGARPPSPLFFSRI
ncbi:hypothetical protein ACFW04_009083 [Cataglyphis niger]